MMIQWMRILKSNIDLMPYSWIGLGFAVGFIVSWFVMAWVWKIGILVFFFILGIVKELL